MDRELEPVLTRIAEALERLRPPTPAAPDFALARLFRHEPRSNAFRPAPDYPLPLASLMGVDVNRVIAATFAIGSALAAVAGVMVSAYYGLDRKSVV